MTPMIDMVFQLIAFFMVLVNFTEVNQNQRIHLPSSELAKPPDTPLESPITIQVTSAGTAILGDQEVPVRELTPLLTLEHQVLAQGRRKGSRRDRGHSGRRRYGDRAGSGGDPTLPERGLREIRTPPSSRKCACPNARKPER